MMLPVQGHGLAPLELIENLGDVDVAVTAVAPGQYTGQVVAGPQRQDTNLGWILKNKTNVQMAVC